MFTGWMFIYFIDGVALYVIQVDRDNISKTAKVYIQNCSSVNRESVMHTMMVIII